MPKWITLIGVLSFSLIASMAVSAQQPRFEASLHVFRIQTGDCLRGPEPSVQTGFRVKQQTGIITALHGVVGCKTITAQPGNDGKPFKGLRIHAFDIAHDVALLLSNELQGVAADGLDAVVSPTEAEFQDVKVIGYPLGITGQQRKNVVVQDTKALEYFVQPQIIDFLYDRSSPEPKVEVYAIDGDLAPGHSGAPLLAKSGRVLAIGNGGLDVGRVGMGWAMPWSSFTWSQKASALKRLEATDMLYGFKFDYPHGYTEPSSRLPQIQTVMDESLDTVFVQIKRGKFEFGSTYAEASTALDICSNYSADLCLWEAFIDEIVDNHWRGTTELADFWIMETEVTNAHYAACVQAGGCNRLDSGVKPSGPPDHPVRLGEVQNAVAYAQWACGRLPTELEWEKAARGSAGRMYPWGNQWEPGQANSCGAECAKKPLTNIQLPSDGFPETAPVYSFEAGRSPYGLYHMAGNVREWVVRDTRRPFSQSDQHMLKGGSFFDFPEVLRAADRLRRPTDNRYPGVITAGFRIVRDSVDYQCH